MKNNNFYSVQLNFLVWYGEKALNNREWNGPHLKYLVWWKRRDSREEWKNATTWWCKYYIYDTDIFTPYEIKVQAVNDFGLGPESPVIIGYSGEDREYDHPSLPADTETLFYIHLQVAIDLDRPMPSHEFMDVYCSHIKLIFVMSIPS